MCCLLELIGKLRKMENTSWDIFNVAELQNTRPQLRDSNAPAVPQSTIFAYDTREYTSLPRSIIHEPSAGLREH